MAGKGHATPPPPPESHPNDDLLLAFKDDVLFAGDKPLVADHLASCARCQARLTALTEDLAPVEPPRRADSTRMASRPTTSTTTAPIDYRARAGVVGRVVAAVVLLGIAAGAGVVAWRQFTRPRAQTTTAIPAPAPAPAPTLADLPVPTLPTEPPTATATDVAPTPEPAPAAAVAPPAPEPTAPPPATAKPLVVASPNRNFMWRVTGLDVERTNDNGKQWRTQTVALKKEITAGTAPSAAVCWLVGKGGTIVMAIGADWKDVSLKEPIDLVKVAAIDSMNATVTADDGRQFSTSDSGMTWHELPK